MAKPPPRQPGAFEKMRAVQINPVIAIVVALVIVVCLAYGFWLRPAMQAAKIQREWTSPENAKLRSPEGKPADPTHEKFIESLRQKEGAGGSFSGHRRH